MTKRCVLLNCEVDDDDMPTLGELTLSSRPDVAKQAQLLINSWHFEPTDVMCEDCFWK